MLSDGPKSLLSGEADQKAKLEQQFEIRNFHSQFNFTLEDFPVPVQQVVQERSATGSQ